MCCSSVAFYFSGPLARHFGLSVMPDPRPAVALLYKFPLVVVLRIIDVILRFSIFSGLKFSPSAG